MRLAATSKTAPPYPRLGEIYRALAAAFDTKTGNRSVDRLAREGEFDWSLLPALVEQLFVAPLQQGIDPALARITGQMLAQFHTRYVDLVSTVALDSLSRDEALPVLAEHYFSPHGVGFLLQVRLQLGGPDLMRLLDPAHQPVATVLQWLDQAQPLASLAFARATTDDRAQIEMIRKWKNGTHLPDRQSIILFGKRLTDGAVVATEKVAQLRTWLIIARALMYFERKAVGTLASLRGTLQRQLLQGLPPVDIGAILSATVVDAGQRYADLQMPVLQLHERLQRTSAKSTGDQLASLRELERCEGIGRKIDTEGRIDFHLAWLRGRWHVLSGQVDLAVRHYERASISSDYRAGQQHRQIIEEALAVAACVNDKGFLKRLKHRAIALGLLVAPMSDTVMQQWEIDHASQHFHRIFPLQARFPEAREDNESLQGLPFLLVSEEEIDAFKPDLRNPGRVISVRFADGQVRRWPQLRLFASFDRVDAVQALLSRGAPVDQLDASGASALLCAIQSASDGRGRRALDVLLGHVHAPSTLNSVTGRKQLTPLLCAIELGAPEVVQGLLEMSANPDLRGNVIDETALYCVMGKIGFLRRPDRLYRYLKDSFLDDPDTVRKELMRRYNVSMAGIFGDRPFAAAMHEDLRARELFDGLVSALSKEQSTKYQVPKLVRIVELLLRAGANPNARHQYPEPGRTPLMLAAENDAVQVFEWMLERGGDPFLRDEAGVNCLQIATGFASARVLDFMRRRRII